MEAKVSRKWQIYICCFGPWTLWLSLCVHLKMKFCHKENVTTQQVMSSMLFCSVCRLGGLSTHRRVSLQSAKDLPSSSNLNRFSWWMKWEMWIKEHTPALLGTCKEPNLHPQLLKLLLKTKPIDLEWHTAGLSHYLLQTFDIHKWQILLIRRIKIPPYSTSLCEKFKKWKCSIKVMTTYCGLFMQKYLLL